MKASREERKLLVRRLLGPLIGLERALRWLAEKAGRAGGMVARQVIFRGKRIEARFLTKLRFIAVPGAVSDAGELLTGLAHEARGLGADIEVTERWDGRRRSRHLRAG